MIIRNHRLEDCPFRESPNHGAAFAPGLPDTIIVHYTAGSSLEGAVATFEKPATKASAHVVVGRDGAVTQVVPFDTVAWHAGRSAYRGRTGFNRYAIGIEIDNAGRLTRSGRGFVSWFGKVYDEDDVVEAVHRNESAPAFWHRFSEPQIERVMELCSDLVDAYRIDSILGHEEIAPSRKQDPGPAFPLDKLRDRVLVRDRGEEGGGEVAAASANVGIVTAARLNIRNGPSLGSATVAPPLAQHTVLEILGEQAGWYHVQVQTRGWVAKDYVKT